MSSKLEEDKRNKRPPKGHKQKGAGTVVVSKGELVKRDGLEIKEWQKTPKQMLKEYCQSSKRPLPIYHQLSASEGKYLSQVVLKDPKDQREKDIKLVPKDLTFESLAAAEHAAALLALHKVDGTRSYEFKLPEPYRSAWLKLTGTTDRDCSSKSISVLKDTHSCEICGKDFTKKHGLEDHKKKEHASTKKMTEIQSSEKESQVSSVQKAPELVPVLELKPKTSMTQYEQRLILEQKARIEREKDMKHTFISQEDWIYMSEENRLAIEALIKDALKLPQSIKNSNTSTHKEIPSHLSQYFIERLGFTVEDVHSALLHLKNHDNDSIFDWLLLHIPEDRLPLELDPKTNQIDIVRVPNQDKLISVNHDSRSYLTENDLLLWYEKNYNEILDLTLVVATEDQAWKSEWEALQIILDKNIELMYLTSFYCFRMHFFNQVGKKQTLDFYFNPHSYPGSFPIPILVGYPTSAPVFVSKVRDFKGEFSAYAILDFAKTFDLSSLAELKNTPPTKPQPKVSSNPSSSKAKIIPPREKELQNRNLLHHYRSLDRNGKSLPVHKFRNEILDLIENNRVVIIRGETGSGKTTQIPKFIFESFIEKNKGGEVSIIVTQPRKLAAVSVSKRVAEEFQVPLGTFIGYTVQLDSKVDPVKTRVEFVTTGILLRRLQQDPTLKYVTHVVVDEVHERSLDSDFLLACLRSIFLSNPGLKIVLMSATFDASLFSAYFNQAPILEIPGFTYPVADFYLEDILEKSNLSIDESSTQDGVNYSLIKTTIEIFESLLVENGSILIFVSGILEIAKTMKVLQCNSRLHLLPLHASLSSVEQSKIFERAPKNKRKVIISTNVAETSITIDDIVCVIDSGKMKELKYDAVSKISTLEERWVSKANARQRRGRAGRVTDGICIRLYSRNLNLDESQTPEVHRVPLDQCILQVASMKIADSNLVDFFSSLIEPPSISNISSALKDLEMLGAIEAANSELTPLGSHLAKLPLDPKIGKLLIYGSLLGVAEDAAVIASVLSRRAPFISSIEKRSEASEAKKFLLSKGIANGSQSDHILILSIFDMWKKQGTEAQKAFFCKEYFLSNELLREMDKLRIEFLDCLQKIGFSTENTFNAADDILIKRKLLKSALCAGLYPNIAKIKRPPKRYVETSGGAFAQEHDAKELIIELLDRKRVFIHPSSVNFSASNFLSNYLVFSEVVMTTKPFLRDSSCVSPYGLLLFGGGKLTVNHEKQLVGFSSTQVHFHTNPKVAVLIKEIRNLLDSLLLEKISNPSVDVTNNLVLTACKKLILGDGLA